MAAFEGMLMVEDRRIEQEPAVGRDEAPLLAAFDRERFHAIRLADQRVEQIRHSCSAARVRDLHLAVLRDDTNAVRTTRRDETIVGMRYDISGTVEAFPKTINAH